MDSVLNKENIFHAGSTSSSRHTHTELNHALINQREKAEQLGIQTELRVADLGLLPLRDESICEILHEITDDATQTAYLSERKRIYTTVLTRTGQFLISVKASVGSSSSAESAASVASPSRKNLVEIRKHAEKLGGNFVCSCDNGMICYTFCIAIA